VPGDTVRGMSEPTGRWNRPPNWPAPPSADWTPPPGWKPDPKWGNPPKGWQFYEPGGSAPVYGMALKKSKTELRIALALGVILLVGIISAVTSGSTSTTTTATATDLLTTAVPAAPVSESPALAPPAQAAKARVDQDAASKAAAAQAAATAKADPASVCLMRPAQYGDLILRVSDPGVPPTAQVLGGGWAYNHDTNTCQNGPDFLLAGVAPGDGHCGQVATAASNPGYNADTSPAPLLSVVLVSKGNCDAPVAAAPVSCTLTGSGTCIRGGEFCPSADGGQPGTDAEGRRYICEDKTHTGRDHWESP